MFLSLFLSACLYDRQRFLELSDGFVDDDGDGYREVDGDCRDNNPDVNPGVVEVCDGIDNDCNEGADELDAADITVWYQDQDQDGYGIDAVSKLSCTAPYLFSTEGGDCDDGSPAFHPNAEELCEEGQDSNCDGYAPHDADGDGYNCDDCNNADASIYPGAPETCNEVDDNCDGRTDNDPVDATTWYLDRDGDGYGNPDRPEVWCEQPDHYVALNTDCDDETADAAPGLSEVCNDGLDTNCDGSPGECESLGVLSEVAVLTPISTYGALGSDVVALGDLNGDGYDDLAVSAPFALVTIHTVYGPFSGNLPVNLVSGLQLEGEETLGADMASAGDQTGDGYPDILATSCIGDYSGDVYLFDSQRIGRFQQSSIELAHISHSEADACAGFGLWGDFDMDGDQQADVAVAAFLGAVPEVSIFPGPIAGSYDYRADATVRLVGEGYLEGPGADLIVEDLDGNGMADLLTSDVYRQRDGETTGEVYLYRDVQPGVLYGSDADVTWWGEGNSMVGAGLELAEDQDGDGEPDLWVGALDEVAGPSTGSIRRMSLDVSSGSVLDRAFVTVVTEGSLCQFFSEDMNLDLRSDLILGECTMFGTDYGRVSLLYGPLAGTLSISAADALYSGMDGVGINPMVAGDTDGDGNLEIVTGAPDENNHDGAVVLLEIEVW